MYNYLTLKVLWEWNPILKEQIKMLSSAGIMKKEKEVFIKFITLVNWNLRRKMEEDTMILIRWEDKVEVLFIMLKSNTIMLLVFIRDMTKN